MANIDKITLPDGTTYNLQDTVSGYSGDSVKFYIVNSSWSGNSYDQWDQNSYNFTGYLPSGTTWTDIRNDIDNNILPILVIEDPDGVTQYCYPSQETTNDILHFFNQKIYGYYMAITLNLISYGTNTVYGGYYCPVPMGGDGNQVLTKYNNGDFILEWRTPAFPTDVPASASIDSAGLISFKNSSSAQLFTLQLPLYNGGVS